MAGHYRDLLVWQRSIELVTQIYRVSAAFPKTEQFGLTSQIRRAAVSVPSNIAEGQSRLSVPEFRQFLGHARGSLSEVYTQLVIALNLELIDKATADRLLSQTDEVGRLLNGLLRAIEQKAKTPEKQ